MSWPDQETKTRVRSSGLGWESLDANNRNQCGWLGRRENYWKAHREPRKTAGSLGNLNLENKEELMEARQPKIQPKSHHRIGLVRTPLLCDHHWMLPLSCQSDPETTLQFGITAQDCKSQGVVSQCRPKISTPGVGTQGAGICALLSSWVLESSPEMSTCWTANK